MSKKTDTKVEVSQKFAVQSGSYGGWNFFETFEEAEDAAQRKTFDGGEDVLVYQAVAKAVPNSKEVKVSKLT